MSAPVANWDVPDIKASFQQLVDAGASEHEE